MRILVIEDEMAIAKALKKGLEQEGYAVDTAQDGESGVDWAMGETYDCILLDWMLPKLSGIDVCKRIRAQKVQSPILFLTSKTGLDDKITGLDAGADDYLSKPFAFEELLARIRALTRRSRDTYPVVLEIAGLKLDTSTFEVRREGQRVDLSRREFALLEYLLRNKNRIVTKDQIISHVWNYDADVLPNTVEVYVGYLRQKLERPFSMRAFIKTVRGFGYIIEE